MTANPFDKRREAEQQSGGFTAFTTLDQMMAECHRRNALNWVKDYGRWYFVVPAAPGVAAHISYIEGPKATEMRGRADGTWDDWDPEPGEKEWIKAATADYVRDLIIPEGEEPEVTRAKFSQHMNRLSAYKPWRQSGEQAA